MSPIKNPSDNQNRLADKVNDKQESKVSEHPTAPQNPEKQKAATSNDGCQNSSENEMAIIEVIAGINATRAKSHRRKQRIENNPPSWHLR